MSQSDARLARRHGLPSAGLGGELTQEAIETTRRTMHGARGVEPSTFVNAEQFQVLGDGHQVSLVLHTPEGDRAFLLSPEDAAAVARRLHDLAGDAARGLFVPSH